MLFEIFMGTSLPTRGEREQIKGLGWKRSTLVTEELRAEGWGVDAAGEGREGVRAMCVAEGSLDAFPSCNPTT